ncbi:hypothetical protein GMST_39770 [Geomonas silvestris]|uniref:Flagellar Assembly Protein A N-terminal region domain-containing protein n=1 Tax=Geomonas silvestris TaxID=2740184 RepID=A0A6V8MP16_9BACT|nr:FapA family protein [Geomonas silvestris]GFO61652.1 hypothetical protein GMST_39770 [Geomonas silvestris]
MVNSELEGSGLQIQLSPEGDKLLGAFTPTVQKVQLDAAALRQAVALAGYGEFFLLEDSITEFVRRSEVSPIAFTLQLGERRDATLSVSVSDDHMSATVSISAAQGGRQIAREDILKALADQGVVVGLLDAEIDAAVAAGKAKRHQVAAGIQPIPGEDTQFVSLVREGREVTELSEKETADYRDRGDLSSVSLGAPLMRRTPATKGIPGMNLLGVELSTTDGVDSPWADNLSNVACDINDPDLLIAGCAGFPVLVPGGISVDPVLRLKRVDLSTGHIRVQGSVEVEGDVTEGMLVTATESITVGGLVEAARLEAGGDIEVKGGVIGHSKLSLAKNEGLAGAAQVKAGGRVSVQFAENAVINAGTEIAVQQLVMQSELTSAGCISVGEPGGRKGHIIGGLCRAAALVHAVVIGSHAGVPTVVEVGVDPALNQKLSFVKDTLEEKNGRLDELAKTLAYVRENPGSMEPGLFQLKEKVFAKLQGEVTELTGEKKRLQKRMEINAQARVEVERDVFLGVQVRIGSAALQIEDDLLAPTFTLGEEGVEYICK